jgi:hypothetical protein
MIASTNSLKRLAERKLRRWGISPSVRGSCVMLCETRRLYLPLGDFFSIFRLEEDIRMADPRQSIMSVLDNRIKNHENAFDQYQRHLDKVENEKQSARETAAGEFEDVLRHVDKIQVQVK